MSQSQISVFAPVMSIVMSLCATSATETPEWVSFPGDQWESITPEKAGLDETKLNAWVASQKPKYGVAYGGQQPEGGGAVITRPGHLEIPRSVHQQLVELPILCFLVGYITRGASGGCREAR